MTLVLVAIAGGLGAATRFLVDGLIRDRTRPGGLPVATLVVNVTGSLLIGLLVGAALVHGFGGVGFAAATTGFCGGYTTFSTAMVETVRLARAGQTGRAAVSLGASVVLTVGAAGLGIWLVGLTA